MRRWVGWAASFVVAAGLVVTGGAVASAATPGASIGPVACAGTIRITSLAFAPTTVVPGQSSVATLHARNCTAQTQQTTTYWYGRFAGPSIGIPTGCPAIDPLPRPATFAANGTVTLTTTYLVFSGCTATSLQLTVQIVGSGGTLLATGNATLAIHQS